MKNVFQIFFIIFGFLVLAATAQVFPRQEQWLKSTCDDSINAELNLTNNLGTLGAYIRLSSSNLKAVNIASDLSVDLDSTLASITQMSTIKNFNEFFNLSGYSVCDYIDIRASFIDLEVAKCYRVISDIRSNSTKLHEGFASITFKYATNLKTLAMNWSRERVVVMTFKQMMNTFSKYFEYIGKLKNNLKFYEAFYAYLRSFKCVSSKSSFAEKGNEIENKLEDCYKTLVKVQNIANDKIKAALVTVAALAPHKGSSTKSTYKATQSSTSIKPNKVMAGFTSTNMPKFNANKSGCNSSLPNLKVTAKVPPMFCLQKMSFNLESFIAVDDYSSVSWPRIPDSTGTMSDLTKKIKLRTCQEKMESYSGIYERNLENMQLLDNDKRDLSLSLQSRRRKRFANPAINDAFAATKDVKDQYLIYLKLLNDSIDKVDQMSLSISNPPVFANCIFTFDVTKVGILVKKGCVGADVRLITDAWCKNTNYMRGLYAINDLDDFNSLKNFLFTVYFPSKGALGVCLNGQQSANGSWFSYDPNPKQIYTSAVPSAGNIAGPYLRSIATSSSQLDFSGGTSSDYCYMICEVYVDFLNL